MEAKRDALLRQIEQEEQSITDGNSTLSLLLPLCLSLS